MEAGPVSWEEHGDVSWMCRDGIRKAKVQLELNLARAENNIIRASTGTLDGEKRFNKMYTS